MKHILSFKSSPKAVGLTHPATPHEARVGEWRVFETLSPHPHAHLQHQGIGEYAIHIERHVSTLHDTSTALAEAIKIAKEIDIVWCYVLAKPYVSARLQLSHMEAPEYWTGNMSDVRAAIQRETSKYYVAAQAVYCEHWSWWPILPLKYVLDVQREYTKAGYELRELINLHVGSHQTVDGSLFLLAKGLEIVGAQYGTRRSSRNAGVQREMENLGVDAKLTKPIAWLYEMANTRFDIRHAWDNRANSLHPKLTKHERDEFEQNADLVLRAFIANKLNVPVHIITFQQGSPESHPKWDDDTLVWPAPA